jgi:hypothetical protein
MDLYKGMKLSLPSETKRTQHLIMKGVVHFAAILAHHLYPTIFRSDTNRVSLLSSIQNHIWASGLVERCWQLVNAFQHLLGWKPNSNREFGIEMGKEFFPIHISIGCSAGPCSAGRKVQVGQFVCSLLCAHWVFKNNSSVKPSMSMNAMGR